MHYTMKSMQFKSTDLRNHRWNVSCDQARAIQENLRKLREDTDRFGVIRVVAGLDASFVLREPQSTRKAPSRWNRMREANRAIACVVAFRLPDLQEVERAFAITPLEFPYVPGLLSFREIPALLAALGKLRVQPDLLFCDGQGYAHPRRMGLASHLGVLLDKPSIGCAKSILMGNHGPLKTKAGSWTHLIDPNAGEERIGAVLRTRDGVRPVYISSGHRISLETAIRFTLAVCDGYRIPRPTRSADLYASEIKRKLLSGDLSEK